MGAWGPAIFLDDLACDVRDTYRELIEDGASTTTTPSSGFSRSSLPG